MKIWNILLIIMTLSLALVTCRKDLTGLIEVDESVMKVDVLKEGASFAAVRVSIDTKTAAKEFSLQLNGEEVTAGQFSGMDTLVFIDSLVPATEYALRCNYWRKGQLAGISGEEKFTTLPLSSNDFTWRVDTVGAFPAQANDLAVIDENNVWAVGYFPRYEGEPSPISNAIKWNGSGYEYYKIKVQPQGSDTAYASPLQTVVSFSQNDIWVFHYVGRYAHFNGTTWEPGSIPWESFKGNITKAWGFSSDDMYLIGTNGSITHYDGQNFTLMESGTDIDLIDIHGYKNSETGLISVFITGWMTGYGTVLKLQDGKWIQVWDINHPITDTFLYPHSVKLIDSGFLLLTVWSGLLQKNRLYLINQNSMKQNLTLSEGFTWNRAFSFASLNNMLITGENGYMEHYNGYEFQLHVGPIGWRNYAMGRSNLNFYAVGTAAQNALFIHGIQN